MKKFDNIINDTLKSCGFTINEEQVVFDPSKMQSIPLHREIASNLINYQRPGQPLIKGKLVPGYPHLVVLAQGSEYERSLVYKDDKPGYCGFYLVNAKPVEVQNGLIELLKDKIDLPFELIPIGIVESDAAAALLYGTIPEKPNFGDQGESDDDNSDWSDDDDGDDSY